MNGLSTLRPTLTTSKGERVCDNKPCEYTCVRTVRINIYTCTCMYIHFVCVYTAYIGNLYSMHAGVCIHMYMYVPDDLGEEEVVSSMVVGGVVMTPELRPGEREVPELVNETTHSLLLSLEPLVVAYVPSLDNMHKYTYTHTHAHTCTWVYTHYTCKANILRVWMPYNKEFRLVERVGIVFQHLQLPC